MRLPLPRPELFDELEGWAAELVDALESKEEQNPAVLTSSFSKTDLPPAEQVGLMIFVTDALPSPIIAYSDGTNWRRVDDATVIA